MSIREEIQKCCASGILHRLLAPGFVATERRILCIHEEVRASLIGPPWQDGPQMRVAHEVAAQLMGFIEGEYVTVREGPPADDNAQVARLIPHDIFELRCLKGMSVRIFGCVAEKDLFIALAWRYRHSLGRFSSPEWAAAIQEAKGRWTSLFPSHLPLTGGAFPDDYISGAIAARDR